MTKYAIELTNRFYKRPKYDCGPWGSGWIGGKGARNLFGIYEEAHQRAAASHYSGDWAAKVVPA